MSVLAAYMGGLAAGAGIAARLAPRVRRPVLVYGLLELGIAASALAVPSAIRAATALHTVLLRRSARAARRGPARRRALLPRVLLRDPARPDRADGRDASAAGPPRRAPRRRDRPAHRPALRDQHGRRGARHLLRGVRAAACARTARDGVLRRRRQCARLRTRGAARARRPESPSRRRRTAAAADSAASAARAGSCRWCCSRASPPSATRCSGRDCSATCSAAASTPSRRCSRASSPASRSEAPSRRGSPRAANAPDAASRSRRSVSPASRSPPSRRSTGFPTWPARSAPAEPARSRRTPPIAALVLLPGALCVGATFPFAVRRLARDRAGASRRERARLRVEHRRRDRRRDRGRLLAAARARLRGHGRLRRGAEPRARGGLRGVLAAGRSPPARGGGPRPDRPRRLPPGHALARAARLPGRRAPRRGRCDVFRCRTLGERAAGRRWARLPAHDQRPARGLDLQGGPRAPGPPPRDALARPASDSREARRPLAADGRARRCEGARGGAVDGRLDRRDRARAGGRAREPEPSARCATPTRWRIRACRST